jgi:hypothetical protein
MPWTNASMVLNSRDATNAILGGEPPYSVCQLNAKGQNIIQGQVHSVSVNEINFPYDIPNVQEGFNSFTLINLSTSSSRIDLEIVIAPGFYTGAELEVAINSAIGLAAVAASVPNPETDVPILSYDDVSNRFTFTAPTAPTEPRFGAWNLDSPATFPEQVSLIKQVYKDLLSIMGFYTAEQPSVAGGLPLVSGAAPMVFTQYIDVCSPQLCKYQDLNTGSTSNEARRSDLIARLYVSNNISVAETEGTRPFIINRQYTNARVMKWNTGNSVGTIDINLYDDTGRPLQYTWLPRPYQITFNAYEMETEDQEAEYEEVQSMGFGGVMGKKLVKIGSHKTYVNKNAVAWQGLARQ